MRVRPLVSTLDGYGSMVAVSDAIEAPDATTEVYAEEQLVNNVRVTRQYLEPLLRRLGSRTVLDVGCGVGQAVATLVDDGYDAFGVDLAPLTRHWARAARDPRRLFVVNPDSLELPFADGALDFVFSFGVIEHIGTTDGHATRRSDVHARRRQWAREVFRVVRPGGRLLLGGPNRGFPVDFSHGPDAEASAFERWVSSRVGVTVHRTWGESFLWSYGDVRRYLDGLLFDMEGLSLDGLLRFGRVPHPMRALAAAYVRHLPTAVRATGFNPWVMALVTKLDAMEGETR